LTGNFVQGVNPRVLSYTRRKLFIGRPIR